MSRSQVNPVAISEQLLGRTGYEWTLADPLCRRQVAGGLGGTANSNLGTAIQCLLVGFDEPAGRILQRALEWVEIAIASGERPQRYFPDGTEALFFHTKSALQLASFKHA